MKFPLSWIREYVELPEDDGAVADAFTLSGSEVEGTETVEGETVCDFGITVNRPDCMNVYGLAREASVLFGRPLRPVETAVEEAEPRAEEGIAVRVEAPDLCPRYVARVVLGVRVGPSPSWMQKRLVQCGLRPINAVVDATNYVLLELGHPLHAFDRDRLSGRTIVVRRAGAGEKIGTLDGVERSLSPENLVIADAKRPVAIAGVMGGEDSGVTFATRDVVLEGAVFDPVSVRRTSKALGLHTDASHRFERGVDLEGPLYALDRCARLIQQICGGRVARGRVEVSAPPSPRPPVLLRHGRIAALTGLAVAPERARAILEGLGFGVERESGEGELRWRVTVPSHRVDVSREADLVEEVVRVHGLSDLPADLPPGVDPVGGRPPVLSLEERLRDALVAAGFREALHMTMTDPTLEAAFGEGEAAALANPLSPQASVLRTSLLGPLVASVGRNRAHGQRRMALFEVGKVVKRNGKGLREERRAAALLYADAPPPRWGEPSPPGLLHLKGRVASALSRLGLSVSFTPEDGTPCAPGLRLRLEVEGRPAGFLGSLSPDFLRAAGVSGGTLHAAEWSLEGLPEAVREPRFRPYSRFPQVVRDFTFLLPAEVPWDRVERCLKALSLPHLKEIRLVDLYTGKGVPEGRKALTFSLVFQSMDRTLSDSDVAPVAGTVQGALQAEFGAVLR